MAAVTSNEKSCLAVADYFKGVVRFEAFNHVSVNFIPRDCLIRKLERASLALVSLFIGLKL